MTQSELDAALRAIGLCVQWQAPLQSTRHVFTHRIWQISGFCGTAAGPRRRAVSGPAARS